MTTQEIFNEARKGHTLSQIGRESGVCRQLLHRLTRGDGNLSPLSMYRVLAYLGKLECFGEMLVLSQGLPPEARELFK